MRMPYYLPWWSSTITWHSHFLASCLVTIARECTTYLKHQCQFWLQYWGAPFFWPEKEAVLQTLTKYRLPHGAWCTEIPLQKPKVSPAYCGRSSDTHITKESGLVDKWLPFIDSIMVDKGFFIDEPCSEHKVKLIWPPSLRKKEQLSKQDAKSNQNIAATQEHVECAIQRTMLFRIFYDSFSRHQLSQIDDIVAIIADLVHPPKFPFKNGRYLST